MSAVSVDVVSRTLEAVLRRDGRTIVWRDQATTSDLTLTPAAAAAADGLLPAFVCAGETIWREVTGKGFELRILSDREATFGYRLRSIGAGTLTTIMLATMEATAQVSSKTTISANDLNEMWSAAARRIEKRARGSSS